MSESSHIDATQRPTHGSSRNARKLMTAAVALTCLGSEDSSPAAESESTVEEEEQEDRKSEAGSARSVSGGSSSGGSSSGGSVCPDPREDENAKIFPQRLMEILADESNAKAISWLPHGKGFIIRDRRKFSSEVLPRYFRKTKYTSFTRKLNRWNFSRVTRGPEIGAYYHKYFQRGQEALCTQMYCKNERAKFADASTASDTAHSPFPVVSSPPPDAVNKEGLVAPLGVVGSDDFPTTTNAYQPPAGAFPHRQPHPQQSVVDAQLTNDKLQFLDLSQQGARMFLGAASRAPSIADALPILLGGGMNNCSQGFVSGDNSSAATSSFIMNAAMSALLNSNAGNVNNSASNNNNNNSSAYNALLLNNSNNNNVALHLLNGTLSGHGGESFGMHLGLENNHLLATTLTNAVAGGINNLPAPILATLLLQQQQQLQQQQPIPARSGVNPGRASAA